MKKWLFGAIYAAVCYSLAAYPALAADQNPPKALARAADLNTNIPCLTTGCTGWYGGFHVEGGGSNADIVGSGLNGSIFDGGVGLGAHLGYQLWNGSIFAAAEVGGTWYTGQGNIVTSLTNVDPRWSVDYLAKFGYGLANLFNSPPTNTPSNGSVIQALAAMLTSPFFEVGGRTRNFGSGLELGAGLQYAIGGGWNASVDYFHVTYNSTQQMTGLPPIQIGSEQGVRLQVNKLFSF